jgi:uncharacterized membrane protein YjgN (DUF898 family)
MGNKPAEAYYVRIYLVNCFVHPLTANLFSSWAQAHRYINGDYSLEESLYLVTGYTIGDVTVITHPPYIDAELFYS